MRLREEKEDAIAELKRVKKERDQAVANHAFASEEQIQATRKLKTVEMERDRALEELREGKFMFRRREKVRFTWPILQQSMRNQLYGDKC